MIVFALYFIFPIKGLHSFVLKLTTALVKGVARKSKGDNCPTKMFVKFGFWLNFLVTSELSLSREFNFRKFLKICLLPPIFLKNN